MCTTDAHFSRVEHIKPSNAHPLAQQPHGSSELRVVVRVVLMSHRNLLGQPDNPPRFPDVLVTALGANCADPRGGSWFGRMAEESPLTKTCAQQPDRDLQRVHTDQFPFEEKQFLAPTSTTFTTAAASDVTENHDARLLISPTVYTGERSNCESLQCLCP